MRTFTDAEGRDWLVTINVATVKRVRAACDVDLMAVVEEQCKLLAQFVDDPVLFGDVLYVVCQAQANERGVTPEQFGEMLANDLLQKATDAFLEALVDFFPQETKRTALRRLLEKIHRFQKTALKLAIEQLENPELDKRIDDAIAKAMKSGKPLTSAPASSDSTPDRSPLPNSIA